MTRIIWIVEELMRMKRRADNHVIPESESALVAAYVCELWDELYKLQAEAEPKEEMVA